MLDLGEAASSSAESLTAPSTLRFDFFLTVPSVEVVAARFLAFFFQYNTHADS